MQDFVKFKMAAAAILDFAQNPVFTIFLVLSFKFQLNWTVNGQVIQDFVKFKMAAAAILDLAQNSAFSIFL